jgi:effector-binding domain-containing protein
MPTGASARRHPMEDEMSEFEIREEPRRRTAVVHGSMPQAEMSGFFDRAYPEIGAAVAAAGLALGDRVFARYFAFSPERVEFEAGITIADEPGGPQRAFDGSGSVQPGELPAGPVAVAMHVGPYEALPATYARLMAWIGEQGREPAGAIWEVYLTNPELEPDPTRWLTEVFIPIG